MALTKDQRREKGIQRMGTMMLQGWVLTDSVCSRAGCGVPTFRNKSSSIVGHCCLCDDKNDPIPPIIDEAFDMILEEEEEDFLEEIKVDSKGPNISSLLGEKLIMGWTMMQECCPTGSGTPLMKDKSDRLFCVSCDAFVDQIKVPNAIPPTVEQIMEEKEIYLSSPETIRTAIEPKVGSNATFDSIKATLSLKLSQLEKMLSQKNHHLDIKNVSDAIESCANALTAVNKL
jgi:uncharacterized Zn finger protein (UPF0148 family)